VLTLDGTLPVTILSHFDLFSFLFLFLPPALSGPEDWQIKACLYRNTVLWLLRMRFSLLGYINSRDWLIDVG